MWFTMMSQMRVLSFMHYIIVCYIVFSPVYITLCDYSLLNYEEQRELFYLLALKKTPDIRELKGTVNPQISMSIENAKQRTKPACVLLQGPACVGKNSAAHVLARTLNAYILTVPSSAFFVRSLYRLWGYEVSIPVLHSFFAQVRNYDKPVVLVLCDIENLFYHQGTRVHQYWDLVHLLSKEVICSHADPEQKLHIVATSTAEQELDSAIRDIFSNQVIYCDYPDKVTRKELFLSVATQKNITLSATLADELAQKTHGYTLHDIQTIAHLTQTKAGNTPVQDHQWRQTCDYYCSFKAPGKFIIPGTQKSQHITQEKNTSWFTQLRERASSYCFRPLFKKVAAVAGACVAVAFFAYKWFSRTRCVPQGY